MKNLVNQNGEETIYFFSESANCIMENSLDCPSDQDTDKSGSFQYWNDGEYLFLYSEGKLWQFDKMDDFATFAEGKDIEPSDIFPEFTDDQFFAVAYALSPSFEEMNDATLSGTNLEIMGNEYLFGTDDEMDELYDDYLDSYIDDCLGIPKDIRLYFDDERWKEDAKHGGDRPSALASYDGHEESHGDYYFYRTN